MPDEQPEQIESAGTSAVTARGAVSLSLSMLSPPRQGDAISGLSLAVAGVGPAAASGLPVAEWPQDVGASDAWAAAVNSETGWYVLLSQDCDVIRDAVDEPTVLVAPLALVDEGEWNVLSRPGYSPRSFPFPQDKFNVPAGKAVVVDLAWTTSVLKGALAAPGVTAVRPLTGPNRRVFAEWLGSRTGRAPFPAEVDAKVLDPFYDVRRSLSKGFDKATSGAAARLESRALVSAVRWYARVDSKLVHVLGELTSARLHMAALLDSDNRVLTNELEAGRSRLEAATVKKMAKVDPSSGFSIKITLTDLTRISAASFSEFALLMR